MKLDSSGDVAWQRSLGGSGDDRAFSIIQTHDSGFAVTGWTNSNDGDVSGNHGGVNWTHERQFDAWVIKLGSQGNLEWQENIGGSGWDGTRQIIQTADSGFAIVGYTTSTDGDMKGLHGTREDAWIGKLNSSGAIQWQKCLGGTGTDIANSIVQTSDRGFVIAGHTNSIDGDVTGLIGKDDNAWIVKLNYSGVVQWQKCLGGAGQEGLNSIIQTSNKSLVAVGFIGTISEDTLQSLGDIGNRKAWLVKLDSNGEMTWEKRLAPPLSYANSIIQTMDGNIAVAGYRMFLPQKHKRPNSILDAWLMKLGDF